MNLALNPFDRGRKPESVEEVELEDGVEEAMAVYDKFMADEAMKVYNKYVDDNGNVPTWYGMQNRSSWLEPWTPHLNPAAINKWLDCALKERPSAYTVFFLNSLINTAMKDGHTEFFLKPSYTLDTIGYQLRDTLNKVTITIDGDVGAELGYRSSLVTFCVKGNAGSYCGAHSDCSSFEIEGDVAYNCGYECQHSRFTFNNAEEGIAYEALGAWFTVNGKITPYDYKVFHQPGNCHFFGNNWETYVHLKEVAPGKVYCLDPFVRELRKRVNPRWWWK